MLSERIATAVYVAPSMNLPLAIVLQLPSAASGVASDRIGCGPEATVPANTSTMTSEDCGMFDDVPVKSGGYAGTSPPSAGVASVRVDRGGGRLVVPPPDVVPQPDVVEVPAIKNQMRSIGHGRHPGPSPGWPVRSIGRPEGSS